MTAHHTHASLKRMGRANSVAKLHRMTGGDVSQDRALVRKAMAEHDTQMHGGKHTKLKLKEGGKVHGKASKPRGDRPGRRAHRDMGGPTAGPQVPMAPAGMSAAPAPMMTPPDAQLAGSAAKRARDTSAIGSLRRPASGSARAFPRPRDAVSVSRE